MPKQVGSTTSLSNICLCHFINCPKICLGLGKDKYVQEVGMEDLSTSAWPSPIQIHTAVVYVCSLWDQPPRCWVV